MQEFKHRISKRLGQTKAVPNITLQVTKIETQTVLQMFFALYLCCLSQVKSCHTRLSLCIMTERVLLIFSPRHIDYVFLLRCFLMDISRIFSKVSYDMSPYRKLSSSSKSAKEASASTFCCAMSTKG